MMIDVIAKGDGDPFKTLFSELPLELTGDQRDSAESLMKKYEDVFSKSDFDLGQTNVVQHRIDTNGHRPFRQPLRRHPQTQLAMIDEYVNKMLKQGIIEPSTGPWASNVVLVRRKDGNFRFCIDYRQLNRLTYQDVYPLPRIEACLDTLDGARWFTTLDLRSGYWQVSQDPRDADKTAFITRRGSFRFKVLSFGLTNAPSVFQRLMDLVLAGLGWDICLVYIDDIIVFSRTFGDHLLRLEAVLQRLREARLKLRPDKCCFFRREVTFLGFLISAKGIHTDRKKIQAVQEWPVPKSLTQVRSFVGLCSYYRKFVKGFAGIAAPLHELSKKGARFVWTDRQQMAFETLKRCLTEAPILGVPCNEGSYCLDTDASEAGLGVVLAQIRDRQG